MLHYCYINPHGNISQQGEIFILFLLITCMDKMPFTFNQAFPFSVGFAC